MVTFAKCFSNYTCFVHADHDGALQWNPHFGNEDRYDIEGRYGTEDFINTHTHTYTHTSDPSIMWSLEVLILCKAWVACITLQSALHVPGCTVTALTSQSHVVQ